MGQSYPAGPTIRRGGRSWIAMMLAVVDGHSFAAVTQSTAMRQFLKFMFASMLGTFLIGIVLILIFIGSLIAVGSSFSTAQKPTTVKPGSILHLELYQPIVDRGNNDDLLFDFGPFKGATTIGLNQILASLENARTDEKIKGVLLDLTGLQAGHATIKEIRDAVVRFKKESGKPVIAFSDSYSQGTYYLATAADQVYLQPRGDLQYHGLRSEYMFYKGLFEKLDIDIQFIRGSNNKFKSFGEVFTEDARLEAAGISPAVDGGYTGRSAIIGEFYAKTATPTDGTPFGAMTGHLSTNMQISLAGHEATTLAYFFEIVDDNLVLIGTYQHRMRRQPDRWRIAFLRITVRYRARLQADKVRGRSLRDVLGLPV